MRRREEYVKREVGKEKGMKRKERQRKRREEE